MLSYRALSTILPAQLSAVSRRRAILYTVFLVSLVLVYYQTFYPRSPGVPIPPPPYTPFASRECPRGQPCPRTEYDVLRLAKQGGLVSAGRPGQKLSCPPAVYSNGSWVFQPPAAGTVPDRMEHALDAIKFSGFEGCASSRQVAWALGADKREQWDRFPNVTSWKWRPGNGCEGFEDWDREKVVRHLVQEGGWLLIGDSVTENHFFSLSCLLYPHVIATPNHNNPLVRLTTNRGSFQHLYLNPSSPLVFPLYPNPIAFPPGFSIAKTPLVTFRRVDILYSKEELILMHQELHPTFPSSTHLFSKEETHTRPVKEALDLLTAPLPYANYGTMIMSTGGHWTTTLFSGYRDADAEGWGVDGVVSFYEHVVRRWIWEVQDRISSEMQKERAVVMDIAGRPGVLSSGPPSRRKNVLIRPYLPGHDNCREARGPQKEVKVMEYEKYNWRHIWEYNHILEALLSDREAYPNIHYLPIDRPGRLRPDAHSARDCLHIMTGSSVLEEWSHFIWNFVAQEL